MPNQVDLALDTVDPAGKKSPSSQQALEDMALSTLFNGLNAKLSDYVSNRYEKEREWTEARKQYDGMADILDDKKLAALGDTSAKKLPTVNITRPKTNIAISRLQDIQFPAGGDYNFTLQPTPVPELDELQKSMDPMPGGPEGMTLGQGAAQTLAAVKEKAHKMELKIRDYLVDSDYGKKARHAMEQLAILGTAVMKAPVLEHKRKRRYRTLTTSDGSSVQELVYIESIVPTVQWVDILTWFPDPSARDVGSITDSFELHPMTRTELRNLSFNPAFMKNRLRRVLNQEPQPNQVAASHVLKLITDNLQSTKEQRYMVMEYQGPISKEVLYDLELISEEEKDDPLVIMQGEAWFVNDEVIRVSVAPLEGEETIPYKAVTWEDDPASLFGHGVPYLMRHAARVVNSSWLMLLDNAGLTAGPQIVLNKEMITPANPAEGWTIRPMKVWFMSEYGANVNEAMQFVNVPTQQESITNVIELALQFADLESSLPAILQGDAPTANNTTFGGLAMVMTASHIIQQRTSEKWDDYVNIPTVESLYHYEMQYGEDNSLKGDFECMAGGATARIDKQLRAQDLERILGMAGSNPEFLQQVDVGQAFREWVATTRAGDILRTREEIEAEKQAAAQNPPPNIDLIRAEAEMLKAQADMAGVQSQAEIAARTADLNAQVEEAKVDKDNREIVTRQNEALVRLQIAQMARENILIKGALDREMSQNELATKLNVAVMDQETKRLLKGAELDMFNTEIEIKKSQGTGI